MCLPSFALFTPSMSFSGVRMSPQTPSRTLMLSGKAAMSDVNVKYITKPPGLLTFNAEGRGAFHPASSPAERLCRKSPPLLGGRRRPGRVQTEHG